MEQQQEYETLEEEDETLPLLDKIPPRQFEFTTWNKILRYQNRLFLPLFVQVIIKKNINSAQATLLPKGRRHNAALIVNKVMSSLQITFGKIWPALFYSTLFIDLIRNDANSELRYGTTNDDIFWGSATNQLTVSTNWGSDIPVGLIKLFQMAFSCLPYNQLHTLTREEEISLGGYQQSISKMRKKLGRQAQTCLGQSGLIDDEIRYCAATLHKQKKVIKNAVNQNKISRQTLDTLQQKLDRVNALIARHEKQNEFMEEVAAKEQRIQQQQQNGTPIKSVITRNVVTGELHHKIIDVSSRPATSGFWRALDLFGFLRSDHRCVTSGVVLSSSVDMTFTDSRLSNL